MKHSALPFWTICWCPRPRCPSLLQKTRAIAWTVFNKFVDSCMHTGMTHHLKPWLLCFAFFFPLDPRDLKNVTYSSGLTFHNTLISQKSFYSSGHIQIRKTKLEHVIRITCSTLHSWYTLNWVNQINKYNLKNVRSNFEVSYVIRCRNPKNVSSNFEVLFVIWFAKFWRFAPGPSQTLHSLLAGQVVDTIKRWLATNSVFWFCLAFRGVGGEGWKT